MSNPLATFLRTSLPAGLEQGEAVQLFLHTFCRASVVPPELAPLTSKEQLADAYSELAREGWIRPADSSDQSQMPPTRPDYWIQVVRDFLLDHVPYDQSEGERLEKLLRR